MEYGAWIPPFLDEPSPPAWPGKQKMDVQVFQALFCPQEVVFWGSLRPGKIGFEILKSTREGGFEGGVYPVHPAGGEVLGYPVYRSLDEVPGSPQLAVISLPQPAVAQTIRQCGRRGIKAAIVISSGFSEVGNRMAEREIVEAAREGGVRIIGPNCAGLMNPWHRHFPSIEVRALPGHTAFMTQSGALGGATLAWAEERSFGFSKFVSYGNRCDLGEVELLSYLGQDPQTRVIALYLEGIDGGQDFLRAVREVSGQKPIVVIKSGRSGAGRRAASSHTGAMAGSDRIYEAAFRRAAILRVDGIEEMFDLCHGLSQCPLPQGGRVAIVTNSGGPGILAADRAEALGLVVAEPSDRLRGRLAPLLSPHASLHNPIDLTVESGKEEYRAAIEEALEEYDGVIAINVATPYLDSNGIARGVIASAQKVKKPVLANFMAGRIVWQAIGLLQEAGLVNLATGERCAFVLAKLVERKRLLERILPAPAEDRASPRG